MVFGLYSNQELANVNFVVLPLVVVLTTLLMAAVALPLGPLLQSMPPLRAYAIDITGSLVGIVTFTVLSTLGTSPTVWFAFLAVGLLALALGRGLTGWSVLSGAAMVGVLYVSIASPTLDNPNDTWSPYHRLTTNLTSDPKGVSVNGIGHQVLWRIDDPRHEPTYEQVYRWFPGRTFDRVLVIGAGTGSDVAQALNHGAGRIDAVEIDPVIASIGRVEPSESTLRRPASHDPHRGRAQLSAELDRPLRPRHLRLHGLAHGRSCGRQPRLESFLYTTESFASVRDHLAPGGIFVMYNWYDQPWLVERLGGMLGTVFGNSTDRANVE